MVIHVVLVLFHLDCSQWGGRDSMSSLELTQDALVCFIRCVDQPLIITCVNLGSCSILTIRVGGGGILSVPGLMQQ